MKKNLEIPSVISTIRNRTGKTMTAFSKDLKVTHATVSRYESGDQMPGHYPLLVLNNLAQGHEKRVISEALRDVLGLKEAPSEEVIRDGLAIAKKVVGELVKIAAQSPLDTKAHRFATEALQVANIALTQPDELPPESIIEVLSLWLAHRDDPEMARVFEDVAGYLRVHAADEKHHRKHH